MRPPHSARPARRLPGGGAWSGAKGRRAKIRRAIRWARGSIFREALAGGDIRLTANGVRRHARAGRGDKLAGRNPNVTKYSLRYIAKHGDKTASTIAESENPH